MNNPLRNFSLMLEAMAELQPEIEDALRPGSGLPKPVPAAPSLGESLSELGPLPREALEDGQRHVQRQAQRVLREVEREHVVRGADLILAGAEGGGRALAAGGGGLSLGGIVGGLGVVETGGGVDALGHQRAHPG